MTGISGLARYLMARSQSSFYDFKLLWNNRWERLPEMCQALERWGEQVGRIVNRAEPNRVVAFNLKGVAYERSPRERY